MAKNWTPSQRELDLWSRLTKESNKVRKALIKTRARQEEETPTGRLPALVIPKHRRTPSPNYLRRLRKQLGREMYQKRLREFKKLFSEGLKSYLRETYKKGYMILWADHIGEAPEGSFGRYSEEQIANADNKRALFMQFYNRINQMSPETFYHMAQKGYLVDFKWIYEEVDNGRDNGALEEQMDNIDLYMKLIGKRGFFKDETMKELTDAYKGRTFTGTSNKEAYINLANKVLGKRKRTYGQSVIALAKSKVNKELSFKEAKKIVDESFF